MCNVRSVTLDCSWLLTPLVATPSALHIFCKSLFKSTLERVMSVGAIWCRLEEAMAGSGQRARARRHEPDPGAARHALA